MNPTVAARRRFRFPSGMGLVNWLCGGWTALIFIFLYVPILLLIIYSFNQSDLNVVWTGFTFDWYTRLWHNGPLVDALKNSLIVASVTTALSVLLGTIGAWLLFRYRFPMFKTLGTLIFVPMVIPEIIMGVSLLIFFTVVTGPLNDWLARFSDAEFGLGYSTVIIAHTTFCFPFVLVAVRARLAGVDPFLEEAALDLGAPPLKAFWLVMVPYLLPAIVSGALMAFTLSLDEYIVTLFTTGPESQTLPIKVFGMAKKGLDPSLNAISTVFILATTGLVVLAETIRKRHR